ncbi:hypothetical protein ARTHRO9AX_80251 [Arthrobacter sp. 9AX]|nr:hypothetical protein ARTHRO9AX_80251 [Arthrobacter sp. 9AX]
MQTAFATVRERVSNNLATSEPAWGNPP